MLRRHLRGHTRDLMAQSTWHFRGNQRFAVRRRLGAGGMGEVYEAYDRESGQTVALKTLTRVDGGAIYRFKREFRALADVTHPNLVSLYELVAEGDSWFFTMELVEGVNFLEYVRGGRPEGAEPTTMDAAASTTMHSEFEPTRLDLEGAEERALAEWKPPATPPCARPDRLRAALRQLAEGLHALHEVGRLHRDIKPSNVLVTGEGRVVVLDFGLVTESSPEGMHQSLVVAGTPAYMAPEQGAGQPVSEVSDWYSVGVMLYEALTGRLPFAGSYLDVLNDKLHHEPVPPAAVVPDVPVDLDALCRDLLRREPAQRPTGTSLLQRLGRTPTEAVGPAVAAPAAGREAPFVGRDEHLAVLRDAFSACREGRTVTVYVHGPSGMGKTTLVRHFLEELQRRKHAVVLAGRCFERESVPYKALDGVVDSLTRYLLSLSKARADALMPRDALILSRLFPVMLRVESVMGAPHREQEIPDPQEVRRRAFAALAELLARVADRQPLVLYIDDLQWSDADSLAFLEDLLRLPDPAPMLLVASFRSDEIDSKPFLKALLARADGQGRRILEVDSLSPQAARDLTTSLLKPETTASRHFVDTIVREAGGSPFLVEQLTRYALTTEATATTGVTLAEMLEARMKLLPPGARALLETLAVAARPVDARLAHQAAGHGGDERPLLTALRAAQLVRTGGAAPQIELYHDRIRETLTSMLEPEAVRRIHQRLAETFEAKGFDNPEALFEHYAGAGDRGRAARYAALAATRASAAFAFDRAALLYRRALELSPSVGSDRRELTTGLAEALANAGECAEAARHYLEAAAEAGPARALDFQRRAAEQLLISGHIDEGLQVIRIVLAAFGMTLSPSPRRALLSMLLRRLRLKLRGLKFVERDAREVPEEQLLRIDICWAVAVGLALVDIIRAADFQTRHLLLALRAGEPGRIARAFAVEAGFSASPGRRGWKRATLFCAKADALARRVGKPHPVGLAILMTGITAYCNGEWRRAAELCETAEVMLREQCTGTAWEVTSAHSFMLLSLTFMGQIGEVARRLPGLLAGALARGNLYATTELRTRTNLVWLAADDPEGARREITEAMRQWSQGGFHRQHYNALRARADIFLYTGDGEAAWRLVTREWPALARSLLLRVQPLRVEATHLRARCALAVATSAADREPWLRIAERLARKIERERMPWSDPLALLVRGAVADARGDPREAARLLAAAAEGFTRAEMALYAAAARRRLGSLPAGSPGPGLAAEAGSWMQGQGIRKPDSMLRVLAPGFRFP